MRINTKEHLAPFDVDKTLILPIEGDHTPGRRVKVRDPVTNGFILMAVHEPMERLLREEYQRGSHVIVWSRGGWEWALAVVNAVGVQDCVHDVYTKPLVYFDDVPIEEWLKYRVYLQPTEVYKK